MRTEIKQNPRKKNIKNPRKKTLFGITLLNPKIGLFANNHAW